MCEDTCGWPLSSTYKSEECCPAAWDGVTCTPCYCAVSLAALGWGLCVQVGGLVCC